MKVKIPQNVKILLWDVPEDNISLKEHSMYIIERILEFGDFREIEWMQKTFTEEEIKDTLIESSRISPKTGSFFSMVYNISKDRLRCIQKPFTKRQGRF